MGSERRIDDEAQLQALGHKGELQRNFSLLSMLGLAFAILNSWTALSSSLGLALPSGGSTSVIWGLLTAGICNLAIAASLAEFLSAYPTAGGQYVPSTNLLCLPNNLQIPLGSSNHSEALGTTGLVDHGMDQRFRLDCSDDFGRTTCITAHLWTDIVVSSRLYLETISGMADIRGMDANRFLRKCFS